jgi:spore coat protein CotH
MSACRWVALAILAVPTIALPDDKPRPKPVRAAAFEPDRVWAVHVTLTAAEFDAMQPRGGFNMFGPAQPKPKAAEKALDPNREVHKNTFGVNLPWATGSVAIGGTTFDNVGIRYKGNGTILDATKSVKKSLKIDLDRYGGKGTFQGMKSIILHSGVADPSKCRETLGYAMYRAAGVPAPRTGLAEVWLTVPGKYDKELLGVYTLIEPIDKGFLKETFGTDQGVLMKPEGLREFADLGDDWAKYQKIYAPKDPPTAEQAARVIAFARLVAKGDDTTFARDVGSFLDIDEYLRYLATTSYIANSDSFFGLGHNFYLYLHPKTNKLRFFPWDVDRAFANLPIFGSNNRQMDLSFVRPYAGTHRLTERILALPGMSERYQRLLRDLATTAFAKDRVVKMLDQIEAATKDLVARDVAAVVARKEPPGGGGPLAAFLGKPPTLRKFIDKRTVSLENQLAGKSTGHIPASGMGMMGFKAGDLLAEPALEDFDQSKDGTLSKAEWTAVAKRLYDASTKDAGGKVDEKGLTVGLATFFPKPPEGTPPQFTMAGFMTGPVFKRADTDADKKVTLAELVAGAEKIFDQFDKAKTGRLDELTFGELLTELFPPPKIGAPPAPPKK